MVLLVDVIVSMIYYDNDIETLVDKEVHFILRILSINEANYYDKYVE